MVCVVCVVCVWCVCVHACGVCGVCVVCVWCVCVRAVCVVCVWCVCGVCVWCACVCVCVCVHSQRSVRCLELQISSAAHCSRRQLSTALSWSRKRRESCQKESDLLYPSAPFSSEHSTLHVDNEPHALAVQCAAAAVNNPPPIPWQMVGQYWPLDRLAHTRSILRIPEHARCMVYAYGTGSENARRSPRHPSLLSAPHSNTAFGCRTLRTAGPRLTCRR